MAGRGGGALKEGSVGLRSCVQGVLLSVLCNGDPGRACLFAQKAGWRGQLRIFPKPQLTVVGRRSTITCQPLVGHLARYTHSVCFKVNLVECFEEDLLKILGQVSVVEAIVALLLLAIGKNHPIWMFPLTLK